MKNQRKFDPQNPVTELLRPAVMLCQESSTLIGQMIGPFHRGGIYYSLPLFLRAQTPRDLRRFRVGFISGLSGIDEAGPELVLDLVRATERMGTHLKTLDTLFYPLLNPSGFEFRQAEALGGTDLAAENWASSGEPEIQVLERHLRQCQFNLFVEIRTADVQHPYVSFTDKLLDSNRLTVALSRSLDDTPGIGFGGTVDKGLGWLPAFDDLPEEPAGMLFELPRQFSENAWSSSLHFWLKFLEVLAEKVEPPTEGLFEAHVPQSEKQES